MVLQSLQSEAYLADTTNPTMAHTLRGSWVNTDGVYQGDNEVIIIIIIIIGLYFMGNVCHKLWRYYI